MRNFGMVLLGLVVASAAWGDDLADARIQAVTTFLLERAQANALAVLERKLQGSSYLHTYYPRTTKALGQADLATILKSRDLWSTSVVEDTRDIVTTALSVYAQKFLATYHSLGSSDSIDQLLERALGKSVVLDGRSYALNSIPLDAPKRARSIINSLYDPILALIAESKSLGDQLAALRGSPKPVSISDVQAVILSVNRAVKAFKDSVEVAFLIPELAAQSDLKRFFQDSINVLDGAKKDFEVFESAYIRLDLETTVRRDYTIQVLKTLEFVGATDFSSSVETMARNREFSEFRRFVVFLAQVLDARDSREIEALLVQVSLPPVSFMIKRDSLIHVLVNSYVGYGLSLELKHGFVGIIDLEVSISWSRDWTLALFVSPLDFGNPITNRLLSGNRTFDYLDVFALSSGLSLSWSDLPLACGVRVLPGAEGSNARLAGFIGIDLPLWIVY